MRRCCTRWSTATGWPHLRAVLLLSTTSCWSAGTRSATALVWTTVRTSTVVIVLTHKYFQDPMKRPTFETLQWKLEDFFTMSDSEYKDASAYWERRSDGVLVSAVFLTFCRNILYQSLAGLLLTTSAANVWFVLSHRTCIKVTTLQHYINLHLFVC